MGDDFYGQVSGSGVSSQGQYKEVTEPQQIPGPVDIVEVYGTGSFVTALSSTGDVWLWGSVPTCDGEYYGLAPRILTNIN